jgi:hypothetical protein
MHIQTTAKTYKHTISSELTCPRQNTPAAAHVDLIPQYLLHRTHVQFQTTHTADMLTQHM